MTSDTMSLSCQISCFPPDCIKQNIQQLALGELLVQRKKKNQTRNIYFIYLLYHTFQRHKSFIYISPKVIILQFFFSLALHFHWHYCFIWGFLSFFFPSSFSHWKPQKSLQQTEQFPFIPVQSGPSVSSSEGQRMCQPQSSARWLSCSSSSSPP